MPGAEDFGIRLEVVGRAARHQHLDRSATTRIAGTRSRMNPSSSSQAACPTIAGQATTAVCGGHPHRQVVGRRADLQRAREDRVIRSAPGSVSRPGISRTSVVPTV